MAQKTNAPILWEYVAHIQDDDGQTQELCGTYEAYSRNKVYQWLLQYAAHHGGWLIANHITEAKSGEPEATLALPAPEAECTDAPEPVDLFNNRRVFGEYTATFKGASLCTYKVTAR